LFYTILKLDCRAHISPSADGLTSVRVGPSLLESRWNFQRLFLFNNFQHLHIVFIFFTNLK
jgi:hypothetical protein